MKIEVRLPTEQYAFIHLTFESMEEYVEKYAEAAVNIAQTRKKAQQMLVKASDAEKDNVAPF